MTDPLARRGPDRRRARPLRRRAPPQPRAVRAGPRGHAGWRPDELDGQVARAVPGLRGRGVGRPLPRRRRPRLRRPLPRRHRRDDGPLAAADRRDGARPGRPRHHRDAARPRTRWWSPRSCGRRFGLPLWQFTLSATDANRHAIRYARHLTGRRKIVVHDYCYHGSVDETFATLDDSGRTVARRGNIGPPVDPAETTTVGRVQRRGRRSSVALAPATSRRCWSSRR